VVAGCAAPIARRAVRSLSWRHLSVDVLDLAAASILLTTGDVLAAGAGVGLVELGERIRSRAAGQARGALRGWLGADSRGVRLLGEGTEPRVPAAQVRIGDRVVVYAGETIPVDGEVIAGEGLIDTRTWTGEPVPRRVTAGAELLAGASVHDGRLVIAVRAAGEGTRAARLATSLEETLASSTRVSDMEAKISSWMERSVSPRRLAGQTEPPGAVQTLLGGGPSRICQPEHVQEPAGRRPVHSSGLARGSATLAASSGSVSKRQRLRWLTGAEPRVGGMAGRYGARGRCPSTGTATPSGQWSDPACGHHEHANYDATLIRLTLTATHNSATLFTPSDGVNPEQLEKGFSASVDTNPRRAAASALHSV
jgi:hypothetical protein